jgi:hypothetical protein
VSLHFACIWKVQALYNTEDGLGICYAGSVISGFRCHVDEICYLLVCYAASNNKTLPTFRDKVSVLLKVKK